MGDHPLIMLGTLVPGALPIESGHSETWKGYLQKSDNTRALSYIKIIDERGLATELLCCVIARKLGLPMTQPFLVKIQSNVLPNITRDTYAFGLEDAEYPSISSRTRDDDLVRKILLKWKFLDLCAVFDSWIGNNDRLPHNLLFDGVNRFNLIDHDQAIDQYLTESNHTRNNLIRLFNYQESEFEKYSLIKRLLSEGDKFNNIDFNEIRTEIIASNGIVRAEIIDSHINILQKRVQFLPNILREQIGIRQNDIFYDVTKSQSKPNQTRK